LAKKILKWAGIGLGAVILVGGSVVLYMGLAPLATHEVPVMDVTVEATPARIARGKKLVSMLCSNCHYNSDDKALSGKLAPYPANFGTFYSENLTGHLTAGIGKWTDGQLLYFLRTGIGPDGRQRFMGSEMHMADEDVLSIIAFLRSDDPLVRPTDRAYPPPAPSFVGRILIRSILKVPDFPTEPILVPDPADTLAYGRYVAHAVAPCFGCHSGEGVMGLDMETPEASEGYMSGGRLEETPWGTEVYIPNITFDVETGIGFVRAAAGYEVSALDAPRVITNSVMKGHHQSGEHRDALRGVLFTDEPAPNATEIVPNTAVRAIVEGASRS